MKLFLLSILSFITLHSFSQTSENQPPIIFEGVVLSATEFYIDSTGNPNTNTTGEYGLLHVYTTHISYMVKISRVLKGNELLDTGTVELISKYNEVTRSHGGPDYENYIPKLYKSVFFSEPLTIKEKLNEKTNNNIIIQPYHFKPMKIDFNRWDNYAIQQFHHNTFKTKEDLAIYLKEKYNVDYLEEGKQEIIPKKKSVGLNVSSPKRVISYNQNLQNYQLFINNSNYKKAFQNNTSRSSVNNLIFEFKNETLTDSANIRFFEFDIYVRDNSAVPYYFDNALIRLEYNSVSFGTNVVANGKVKISKGNNFNNLTYIDPNSNAIDQTTSVIGIPFGSDFNTSILNRTLVNGVGQQLLHIRLEINQCNTPANIDFTDINFTPNFSFYAIKHDDPITSTVSYTNTAYGQDITDELCKPIITYFTPNVKTGIGDSIIIEGKYFGIDRISSLDTAHVRFRNANEYNVLYLNRLDSIDYLYWSDNEIRVSATSYVITEGETGIGTGKFIVKNKWSDTTKTNSPINVEYAVLNQSLEYADGLILKKRRNLVYDSTGYVFSFSSTILNNSGIKTATEKAIIDWSCHNGFNVKFKHYNPTLIANSSISFDSISSLMVTSHYKSNNCYQPNTRLEMFLDSFTIVIDNQTNWDYDTSGSILPNYYCYYTALLHELGHVHQLGHVLNDSSELMRPTINTEIYKSFSPNTISGASDIKNYTQTHLYSNCIRKPMVFIPNCGNNGGTNSVNSIYGDDDFTLYPNPFDSDVNIVFDEVRNNNSIIIYNALGRLIYNANIKGDRTLINLESLSSGTYLITIHSNGKNTTKRLIKL